MGQREDVSVVPSLVGLPAATAHDKALDANLLAVDQDPSHKPNVAGVVTAQEPQPGAVLNAGNRVLIWVSTGGPEGGDGGGGGNQKLPTGPKPVEPAGTK